MKIADVGPRAAAVSNEELRAVLSTSLGSGHGGVTITGLSRKPFGGTTSFPAESIDVETDTGRRVRLFLKDMSSTRLPKEGIEDRRRRELSVYRDLLSRMDVGTPRYYGAMQDATAGRLCLLLEHIEGTTLETLGFDHWVHAARWLGRFQGMWTGQELGPEQLDVLVSHDRRYFQSTAEQAQAAVRHLSTFLGTRLASALRDYDRRIAVMVAQARTVVHGSFRPANILIDRRETPPRVCPVDWELAAWGAPLYDLAFLADGCGPPDLDTYWQAYGEGAAAHGMTVPVLEEVRWVLDSFYLHKLLKALSQCLEWRFPQATVATLVELVEQRSKAT